MIWPRILKAYSGFWDENRPQERKDGSRDSS
jgi:hypothetical protein